MPPRGRRRSRPPPGSTDPRCRAARRPLASRRAAGRARAPGSARTRGRASGPRGRARAIPAARRSGPRDPARARRAPVPAARQPPLRLVERDPVEPSRELRAFLESRQAAPGAQEHLLRHLVGLVRVEPKPPQRAVDAVGVDHDELRERVLVAGARPPNQLMLGGRRAAHRAVIPPDRRARTRTWRPPSRLAYRSSSSSEQELMQ